MDIAKDIRNYRLRRQRRLDSRRADAEEKQKTGNTKLPYALCKKEGIDTTGMTPSEAWKVLEGQTGINPKDAYKQMGERSRPRKGVLESAKPAGTSKTWATGELDKLRVSIDNDLGKLPLGAVVKVGSNSYQKLSNGVWGAEDTPFDPRYQKSHDDFLDKIYTGVMLGRHAPTYEITGKAKRGNTEKLTSERLAFIKESYPSKEIKTVKKAKGYTDFEISQGESPAKTVRVYESSEGNPMMCVITDDLKRKMAKLRGGKAS